MALSASTNQPAAYTLRAGLRRYGIPCILLCVALLFADKTCVADDARLLSETEYFSNIPSVDSVTRLPQPRSETPASVTVIDTDMIRATGARDLADIFRLIPGFQVAYPRGHRPTVTYHGLGDDFSRRMQILIDGRSVYTPMFGHVSWSAQSIAIEDIDHIEVIRGPNTASYGANAFLGTINIITRHSLQQQRTAATINKGDHGIADATVRGGTTFDNGSMRLSTGYMSDGGLLNLPDDDRTRFANLRGDIQVNNNDKLLLQTGISRADSGEGFYDNPELPPRNSEVSAHFEQIQWQRRLPNDDRLSLQFYHNYHELNLDYLSDPLDLGPPFGTIQVPVSFGYSTHRYDLELQHTLRVNNDWRLVWGMGARQDRARSRAYLGSNNELVTDSARLFINNEWQSGEHTVVNLGAMLENTDFTGQELSPRLAVNHHLNSRHTLRAAWSRAQRIPSYLEEYSNQQFFYQNILLQQNYASDGGLQPEIMDAFELGYLGQFPHTNSSIDLRIYRDRISDFITEVRIPANDVDGYALSFRNHGQVTVEGVDLQLMYRAGRNTRIVANYAWMRASGSQAPDDAVGNQRMRLESVPQYTASLLFSHRFRYDWQFSLNYYLVDDMLWLSNGDLIPGYDRIDCRIARGFSVGATHAELALVVQNIGDDYYDFADQQLFDTRAYLSLKLDF